MNKIKFLYILSISLFAFPSCEKVIEIDLNEAAPRIVVEAQVTNIEGFNFVSLSKTSSFYSKEPIERIVGATVEVSDILDNKYILEEVSPGMYTNKTFGADSNGKYKLHVDTGAEVFEAFSKAPTTVKIDSIKIEQNDFGPKNKGNDSGDELHYKIITYFLDNVNEENFYRLRLVINGEYYPGFYVIEDKVFDGKTIPYNFSSVALEDKDQVSVELLGIDEANFNYFYTLQRLQGGGKDITPGNPPTNITGGAIGIFGVSTFDSMDKIFNIEN